MTRHREQNSESTWCGTYTSPIGPTTLTRCMDHGMLRTSDDVIGNREGVNPLSLMTRIREYPVLNGSFGGRSWVSHPIAYRPGPPDPRSYFGSLNLAQLNALAWKILAMTNPSEPHVNVPQMVCELKDLPSLFKGMFGQLVKAGERGNTLRQALEAMARLPHPRLTGDKIDLLRVSMSRLASSYLVGRWVTAPMIRDLLSLLGFVKAVDDRIIMLLKLQQDKVIRRRCIISNAFEKSNVQNNLLLHSESTTIRADRHELHAYKMWGTTTWKLLPESVLPGLGFGPIKDLARNITRGTTVRDQLATAWELTPWSWLIDWFSNVSDVIAATNNSVGLTFGDICLMRHSKSSAHYKHRPDTSSTGPTIVGWYEESMERKERWIVFPVIPFPLPELPMLTHGQWSILAALAASRL